MINRRALELVTSGKCARIILENQINLKRINRASKISIKICQICNDHKRVKSNELGLDSVNNQNGQDKNQMNHTNQRDCRSRSDNERRFNQINIQMLSKSIHEQVFPANQNVSAIKNEDFAKIRQHLDKHGLWGKDCTVLNDVNFKIPKFHGKNISEHFENIAKDQISKYLELAKELACSQPPPMPKSWLFQKGWTKYAQDGATKQVECPDDDVIVFDVEICMNESELPIMATAASPNAWYFMFVFIACRILNYA